MDMQVFCIAVIFPNGDVHSDGTQTDNCAYLLARDVETDL